ncbi:MULTISPECIES: nucleoside triphosphate pyrophosphohydrolase family protein [unclassified Rhodococcus (in: high G+C Gram-positive bacteria)]|uniref:nucleoside triphosphate pyrophosphohydrolase family protein n=1 Tax=unclassified Rhodococcus (in: high G+C Gram-positive bacteria) TaxID=192944 RepID=UPI000B9A3CBF|nr:MULTISPECIES: nucleoside triphosphate pyrophosphohydrolase family protein [unclassified Rhodococcus (in: high G+C Gram-positive bacteria)]OZE43155.1 hypothetical protein CH259_00425 [Rhodococcus sp. 05-2254-4]OZE47341.1 hypothetical protein CH261_10185 [Rhodococcus sp. 05-2254-3]OZE47640.1 hypothetical protein CH283_18300 [Rhodococcus sp. 05-2254-2]
MQINDYQERAQRTDQRPGDGLADLAVHLLGLAGEAGSVASEYKKYLRDGDKFAFWKSRMREELGDVMWYVSAIATHLGLELDEVAQANLEKTRLRWSTAGIDTLDQRFPLAERLPTSGTYEFRPSMTPGGRRTSSTWFEGRQVGSKLTDASSIDDGYRFHDVFHLAYAFHLGWSPVTRALLGRKRRSDPNVDENEDGGRAMVIEEGVAALVFAYATQHNMLDGVTRLDQRLLDMIEMLAGATEVGVRGQGDWERAVLAGFKAFRTLNQNDGGRVDFDIGKATFDAQPLA